MTYWTVPPMFKGRTVVVLASGESMSQEVADAVKHLPRIVINTTYKLAPDADIIYATDSTWWYENPEVLECPGLKVSLEPIRGMHPNTPPEVLILRNSGQSGFDPDPSCLRMHLNSGGDAVQVAAKTRPSRILLCGFNMQGGHWHADHALKNPNVEVFATWIANFRQIAPILATLGIDVVNCTEDSALDCFRRMSLADALAMREAA